MEKNYKSHLGVFKIYKNGPNSVYSLAKEYKDFKSITLKETRDTSKFRSFEEAKAHVKEMNISSRKEWNKYFISGQKPDDIPHNPDMVYVAGWKGWNDFLANPKSRFEDYMDKMWDLSDIPKFSNKFRKSPPKNK